MLSYRRIAIAVAVAVAAFGLTACGSVAEAAADFSSETKALAVASADPSPSASPDKNGRRKARALLRRNTLHGEVVVQTKDGTKTVLVQRGAVTAIDGTTMTVKSTDGYTQTWTFGDPLRVVEHRATIQPKDVAVGAQVGVAGRKDGDKSSARLVVVN